MTFHAHVASVGEAKVPIKTVMFRMPKLSSADEAGRLYHALNLGDAHETIFHKDEDHDAFERIIGETLKRYEIQLFAYQLMPNN